ASRLLVRRLNRVDLPTFGRPTRAITGTMRLSTAIFQKTRRPLQGSGRIYSVPPERNDKQALKPPAVRTVWPSVPLADGQRNQLAIVAVSVQPVTLDHRAHPQTGTVDAGASDETAVDL